MKQAFRFSALLTIATAVALPAWPDDGHHETRRTLLISVDGLHALDVARYVSSHPHSALAELASHGVVYSSARTPRTRIHFPACWPWSREVHPSPTACSTT